MNSRFTVALDHRDNGKTNHRAAQTHGAGCLSQHSEISQIASSCIHPKLLASPGAVWQQSIQLKIRHRARSLGHTNARSLVSWSISSCSHQQRPSNSLDTLVLVRFRRSSRCTHATVEWRPHVTNYTKQQSCRLNGTETQYSLNWQLRCISSSSSFPQLQKSLPLFTEKCYFNGKSLTDGVILSDLTILWSITSHNGQANKTVLHVLPSDPVVSKYLFKGLTICFWRV